MHPALKLVNKPAQEQNWESAHEFVLYLRNQLIPDLRESGYTATADDFQTAADTIAASLEAINLIIK